jgi:RNA 2',3'-cyclic 3'-phosphodiesterase
VNVRLFVAADLPDDVRTALVAWRPRADALRGVEPDALHVTLAFLGWRDDSAVERIGAAAIAQAGPLDPVTTRAALWLPKRRPRVLTVELDDPAGGLAALQRRVSDAMVDAAGYVPEDRPFLPHVTVARVRRGQRAPRDELPPPPELAFTPTRVTLYRSQLGREGARYEPLASAPVR